MRSITWLESELLPLAGASESSSSKNKIQGRLARPLSNTSRIFFSLSPMYMLSNSGPLTEIKFKEHSVAIAFASSVLPVPGGPKNSSPERGAIPDANSYG